MRNTIYVCDDGAESAKQLYDCDVIGLPITIVYHLQTIWHRLRPGLFDPPASSDVAEQRWLDWLMESQENYVELWNYGMDIADEHAYRFGDQAKRPYRHASCLQLDRFSVIPPSLPDVPATPRPPTPLDEYKTVAGFWATFTNREKPEWAK